MDILRAKQARTAYEYGCDMRRLYPWNGVADPLWGSAICSVRPGESTTPHSHDEDETFVVLAGRGMMTVDKEQSVVEPGDVIFLPRNSAHTLRNNSPTERLDFLTIWWGSPEAQKRMIAMADALKRSA